MPLHVSSAGPVPGEQTGAPEQISVPGVQRPQQPPVHVESAAVHVPASTHGASEGHASEHPPPTSVGLSSTTPLQSSSTPLQDSGVGGERGHRYSQPFTPASSR